jgi:hypothetical protein|tara:strand:+ start:2222 stop:2629 length:408 start_codon:yes stop_codon:yes gene_type:complete
MNKDRLQLIHDIVKEVPDKKFDMDIWMNRKGCATAGCAIGWAASDPRIIEQGLHLVENAHGSVFPVFENAKSGATTAGTIHKHIAEFLDISVTDSLSLFDPEEYYQRHDLEDEDSLVTKKMVLADIAKYIETGEV